MVRLTKTAPAERDFNLYDPVATDGDSEMCVVPIMPSNGKEIRVRDILRVISPLFLSTDCLRVDDFYNDGSWWIVSSKLNNRPLLALGLRDLGHAG